MEEERNIGKIFYKNGFEFTNLRALVREAENVDLNDLLDRLLDLEKKMNSSAEIKDLASYVDERLESIEKIVNDDSYFNLSDVAVKSDYNAQVKAIKDKFHYARHLLDAEAEWKKQQDNYEKATIIGTTTFGKGVIQTLLRLSDGSGLKMTTEEYIRKAKSIKRKKIIWGQFLLRKYYKKIFIAKKLKSKERLL